MAGVRVMLMGVDGAFRVVLGGRVVGWVRRGEDGSWYARGAQGGEVPVVASRHPRRGPAVSALVMAADPALRVPEEVPQRADEALRRRAAGAGESDKKSSAR